MKKILFCLLTVLAVSAIAGNTLITGFDAVTGIGTFKVVSDGTDATLTVDKLVVSDAITNPGGVTGSSSVATNVASSSAAITATAVVTTQTAKGYIADVAVTNAAGAEMLFVTNATVAVTIVNGGNVVTNITASLSPIKFVSGICTNKP